MARPLRIEFRDALYHVTARGNERKPIFRDDRDRARFLECLGGARDRHRLVVHAFVLMRNHYHLLVQTPAGGLGRALRQLNGVYAQSFNRRHDRVGHLFQGRYKALLVQRDAYLLELSRYIHLNPVRVGEVARAWDFPWSSAAAYVGMVDAPRWLTIADVLSQFGRRLALAQRRYAAFLADDGDRLPGHPWHLVEAQTLLGERRWIERIKRRVGQVSHTRDLPAAGALRCRPSLSVVITQVGHASGLSRQTLLQRRGAKGHWARSVAMALAVDLCGLSHGEIGRVFGVGPSAVSKATLRAASFKAASGRVGRAVRRLKSQFKT